MSSVVIVPTYNEKENIRSLVEQLLALPIELQVIVVDDNSPDGTGAIADELAASNSYVQVIHRSGKLGLGTAYIAGFKAALSMGADHVLTMDADFSHHPRYVPDLVARSRDADLVIGSRYVRGGGTVHCTLPRKVLSWGANAFAKTVLWLQAMDCTAGFRCYRREVLEGIGLDTIFSDGYSFLIEMLYRVQRQGWRIAEVPIVFENRRHGASKISRQEVMKAMYTVVRLGVERFSGSPSAPVASQR
ncbi:MAG: polyprenol monophosphomannose synthase [Chloroflexota bacterium]|nr:polyprenol monophosphomannose synthase [Chloroflexota bacterium]